MNPTERAQITLRVPKELDRKLTLLAKKKGVPKNAFIVMMLDKALEAEKAG